MMQQTTNRNIPKNTIRKKWPGSHHVVLIIRKPSGQMMEGEKEEVLWEYLASCR